MDHFPIDIQNYVKWYRVCHKDVLCVSVLFYKEYFKSDHIEMHNSE